MPQAGRAEQEDGLLGPLSGPSCTSEVLSRPQDGSGSPTRHTTLTTGLCLCQAPTHAHLWSLRACSHSRQDLLNEMLIANLKNPKSFLSLFLKVAPSLIQGTLTSRCSLKECGRHCRAVPAKLPKLEDSASPDL